MSGEKSPDTSANAATPGARTNSRIEHVMQALASLAAAAPFSATACVIAAVVWLWALSWRLFPRISG